MKSDEPFLKDIGWRIRQVRETIGLRQRKMAKELGVSCATLSQVEAGKGKPGFDVLFNLSKKFKVNIQYLFQGKGDMFNRTAAALRLEEMFSKEQADFLEKFLVYFKESELVRFSVMAYFKKCLLENAKLIDLEITAENTEKRQYPEETGGKEKIVGNRQLAIGNWQKRK